MGDIDSSKPLFDFPGFEYNRSRGRVGDWIYRLSDLPSLTGKPRTHHGVVVAVEGEDVGVYDLQIQGYRVVDLAEFASGMTVVLHRAGIVGQEDQVWQRALDTAAKQPEWSLLWTCEDAAAFVHDGQSKGTQGMQELMAARHLGARFADWLKK